MSYRVRLHPAVSEDLDAITRWLIDYAGRKLAERRLAEIEEATAGLGALPHKGTVRDEIAPGLRAIPAGRKAVVACTVDDEAHTVFVHAVTYAGADWISRSRTRSK